MVVSPSRSIIETSGKVNDRLATSLAIRRMLRRKIILSVSCQMFNRRQERIMLPENITQDKNANEERRHLCCGFSITEVGRILKKVTHGLLYPELWVEEDIPENLHRPIKC